MNSTTTHSNGITTQDILDGYDNPEWLGWGYFGERQGWLTSDDPECPAQPERVAQVDMAIVAEANRRRWTARRLFRFLNSRDGRHFADAMFGCDAPIADVKTWMGRA